MGCFRMPARGLAWGGGAGAAGGAGGRGVSAGAGARVVGRAGGRGPQAGGGSPASGQACAPGGRRGHARPLCAALLGSYAPGYRPLAAHQAGQRRPASARRSRARLGAAWHAAGWCPCTAPLAGPRFQRTSHFRQPWPLHASQYITPDRSRRGAGGSASPAPAPPAASAELPAAPADLLLTKGGPSRLPTGTGPAAAAAALASRLRR